MSEVVKSRATDFGGNLNTFQFSQEIATSSIVANCVAINTEDDVVTLVFDATLDGAEQTTLDGLISGHVPNTYTGKGPLATLTPRKSDFKSSQFGRVASFIYNGTNNVGLITMAAFASYINSNSATYTVRAIHNATVIFEETFNNTTEAVKTVNIPANLLPTEQAAIEFQVKINGAQGNVQCNIETITLFE